ncbi:MAG: baseplate J/gp47 family protein, partial [Patescibacteria group bacterium]|nr:baseplate J/gp47 family protein [Patescibacteria group bacterium]
FVLAGIILCAVLVVLYIFGVSAKVTLTANPKILSNQQPVTFVTDGSSNVDQGTLAGQTVSVDEKGSLSEQTTGVKQVGTPAKGSVTIVNVSDTASLSAGTVLTSSDGKKFTLDSATDVPAGDVITPGTTSTNVTASDIGPEYNMPSGTKFTIGSSATIGAKNDTAFSGGTKKDVIIVSQADVDKLSSDLIKGFEDKAKADLGQQVGENKTLLPFFTKEDISQEAFNSKVGDQAQNLSLTATVTYESIVVDKTDMTSFASRVLQGNIPSDLVLTSDGIQTSLSDIQQNKNAVSGTLTMKASLLPKVNTTDLAKSLTGKSFQQASDIIKALPQIQSVDFVLSPNLPLLPKVLPRIPNHIHVILLSQ